MYDSKICLLVQIPEYVFLDRGKNLIEFQIYYLKWRYKLSYLKNLFGKFSIMIDFLMLNILY